MPVDIVIGIVNLSRYDLLNQCLRSISGAVGPLSWKVHVLDNASTDGSSDLVRHNFPWVVLREHAVRRGFVANMNDLMRSCAHEGRYFVMLNNDTVLQPGSLERVARFLDTRPDAAAATPALVFGNGLRQMAGMPFPTPTKELWRFSGLRRLVGPSARRVIARLGGRWFGVWSRQYLPNFRSAGDPWEVDYATGACLVVRVVALRQVGFLSDQFAMYGEDVEWCYRARRRGWTIWVVPSGTVVHYAMQSLSEYSMVEFERSSVRLFAMMGYANWRVTTYRLAIACLAAVKWVTTWLSPFQSRLPRAAYRSALVAIIRVMLAADST